MKSAGCRAASLAFVALEGIRPVCALTCYCLGHCQNPDEPSVNETSDAAIPGGEDLGEGTYCVAKPGARCFGAVEQVYDPGTEKLVPERTYGCLPPDERGLLQCKGALVPHLNPTSIACCSDGDFCNRRLKPVYDPSSAVDDGDHDYDGGTGLLDEMGEAASLALLVSLTLCFVLLVIFVAFLYLRFKKREDSSHRKYMRTACSDPDGGALSSLHGGTLSDLLEQSSGSGSGLPLLVQRTIAKQIHMVNPVGKGRYGEVWLAKWRGESIAVKVFFTTDEASWFRETEIYQTVLMRHDNILGFIAADIRGTGGCTQMLLITDYHEYGSLHDFLKFNILTEEQMVNLAFSAASGIFHLHTEIPGTRGKPAIAHRDIKSRNILIKRDLTCAIADFGLAVRFDSKTNKIDIGAHNARVGTTRYMAPEVLSQCLKFDTFESFKRSDMYSFGLVLWEICRRTHPSSETSLKFKTGGGSPMKITYTQSSDSIPKTEYSSLYMDELSCELPYFEYVGSDPSFDEMHSVVVSKSLRPNIGLHWKSSESLSIVTRLMKECWHHNPSARLSMLRVKKSLSNLKQSQDCKGGKNNQDSLSSCSSSSYSEKQSPELATKLA